MNYEKGKLVIINKLKHDTSYLLNRITGQDNQNIYDLYMVKLIKSKPRADLTDYEKCFLSYWSNKLIYNMIENNERDRLILETIKKDELFSYHKP